MRRLLRLRFVVSGGDAGTVSAMALRLAGAWASLNTRSCNIRYVALHTERYTQTRDVFGKIGIYAL